MAINLANKYGTKVANKFYTDSIVAGKTSTEFDWDGVKTVNVLNITSVTPGNYTMSGTSRYGTPTEVQDTMQTLTVAQDKSVSLTVDKGNSKSVPLVNKAGQVMAIEMREQFIPMFDKYCLGVFAAGAKNKAYGALTKANIVEKISDGITALVNEGIQNFADVTIYVPATNFGKLVLSPEFLNLEKLGTKAVGKGVVGEVRGVKTCQVPDSYMTGVEFIIVHKASVLAPTKIKDMKLHEDAPGISGALLEIRWMFDAFVLDGRNGGVYAHTTTQQ